MRSSTDSAATSRYPAAGVGATLHLLQAKARGARFLSWLVSGSCAAGFLVWASSQPVPRLPSNLAQSLALAGAVMAYTAATFGLCERWTLLMGRCVPGIPRAVGYRPVVVGQLGNVFLPARAGDAIRVGLSAASREEVSTQTAVGVLIAERVLDVGCHAALLVAVLTWAFGLRAGAVLDVRAMLAIAAGLLLAIGAFALARPLWRVVSIRLPGAWRAPGFARGLLAPLIGLREGGGQAVLLSVAMWLCEVAGWWAGSHAVGLDLTGPQAAYVFAIASLALIMPVGFGSIGTLDAGIVFGVKTVGASTAAVLSFVVLLRVLVVLPSFLMALAIAPRGRLARLRKGIGTLAGRDRSAEA